MKILQLFAIVLVSETVYGKISEIVDNNKIAIFIRDVIKENNLKTKTVGDVAIFKISNGRYWEEIDRIYDQICREIPEENPVLKPDQSQVVKNPKLWVASFIIIVANANHPVIIFILVFSKHRYYFFGVQLYFESKVFHKRRYLKKQKLK